ncbi:MAG: hypothetical protein COB65_13715 [Thalassobium sp.]|nr:MAG: hypothetical protein COB65_13715 [Thalassobium sp.]
MTPDIRLLADVPEFAADTARLLAHTWPQHYGAVGAGDAVSDLVRRIRHSGLPIAVVALHGTRITGTATLSANSFGKLDDEVPWLIGLCVAPDMRGGGLASALVAAIGGIARDQGFGQVHTTTQSARGLLLRRNWQDLRTMPNQTGAHWTVMRKSLA